MPGLKDAMDAETDKYSALQIKVYLHVGQRLLHSFWLLRLPRGVATAMWEQRLFHSFWLHLSPHSGVAYCHVGTKVVTFVLATPETSQGRCNCHVGTKVG